LLELAFAFAAGLLTLINPCVLPVIPITLASAASSGRAGPLALAAGMSAAFVILGVGILAFGPLVGLSSDAVASAGALVMVLFGVILLARPFEASFAGATAGLAQAANLGIDRLPSAGLPTQFAAGALLGAVWSPCIGPTLGGAIALASQGESLGSAALIMLAFAAGVSTFMLAIAYGARGLLASHGATLKALAGRSKPIFGVTFVVLGLLLFFNVHHVAEAWLIDRLPGWLVDASVAI
jgi:cytochrome c-type biogenesis protein